MLFYLKYELSVSISVLILYSMYLYTLSISNNEGLLLMTNDKPEGTCCGTLENSSKKFIIFIRFSLNFRRNSRNWSPGFFLWFALDVWTGVKIELGLRFWKQVMCLSLLFWSGIFFVFHPVLTTKLSNYGNSFIWYIHAELYMHTTYVPVLFFTCT